MARASPRLSRRPFEEIEEQTEGQREAGRVYFVQATNALRGVVVLLLEVSELASKRTGISTVNGRPPQGAPSEERLCAGSKPNGEPCRRIVGPSQSYCYSHSPERAAERSLNASKAGKSKPGRRVRDLDNQLAQLYEDALAGVVDRGVAAVLCQIVYGRTCLLEAERRIREVEEIEKHLEAIEARERGMKVRR